MSAYSVGTSTFDRGALDERVSAAVAAAGVDDDTRKRIEDAEVAPSHEDGLSAVIKWVPGEAIGAYCGVVAGLQAAGAGATVQNAGARREFLIIFSLFAALMVLLGGNISYRGEKSTGKMAAQKRIELVLRALLAAAGLILWSYMIPGTVTQQSQIAQTYKPGSTVWTVG